MVKNSGNTASTEGVTTRSSEGIQHDSITDLTLQLVPCDFFQVLQDCHIQSFEAVLCPFNDRRVGNIGLVVELSHVSKDVGCNDPTSVKDSGAWHEVDSTLNDPALVETFVELQRGF